MTLEKVELTRGYHWDQNQEDAELIRYGQNLQSMLIHEPNKDLSELGYIQKLDYFEENW